MNDYGAALCHHQLLVAAPCGKDLPSRAARRRVRLRRTAVLKSHQATHGLHVYLQNLFSQSALQTANNLLSALRADAAEFVPAAVSKQAAHAAEMQHAAMAAAAQTAATEAADAGTATAHETAAADTTAAKAASAVVAATETAVAEIAGAETAATEAAAAHTAADDAATAEAAAAEAATAEVVAAETVAAHADVTKADEPKSAIDGRVDGLPSTASETHDSKPADVSIDISESSTTGVATIPAVKDAAVLKSAIDGRVDGLPSKGFARGSAQHCGYIAMVPSTPG